MPKSFPNPTQRALIAGLLVAHAGSVCADDPYRGSGYGNTNPYARGFSDVGQGGWVNDEPQFRPLEPSNPARTQAPDGYRPQASRYPGSGNTGAYGNPGYRTYAPSGYGASPNVAAPYGNNAYGESTYPNPAYPGSSYGDSGYGRPAYPDPGFSSPTYSGQNYSGQNYPGQNYPGGGYVNPGYTNPGYTGPDSGGSAYRGSGYPAYRVPQDNQHYLPGSRYPDAYTPPPVIDWSRSLPRPGVSLEDFPLSFAPGEGLGASAPHVGADPSLPYELPYRSESLPPAAQSMPHPDPFESGQNQGGSLIDNMLGKPRRSESAARPPQADYRQTSPTRADYPELVIPPAPPRDILPPPGQTESHWTPPGQDGFRPLSAEERADWSASKTPSPGNAPNPRADSEPRHYYVPSPNFNERLQESARAFENRLGTQAGGADPYARPPKPETDTQPSHPSNAPPMPSPEPYRAPDKPQSSTPLLIFAPAHMEQTTPPSSGPVPSEHDGFRPDAEINPQPAQDEQPVPLDDNLPPRVESGAETG